MNPLQMGEQEAQHHCGIALVRFMKEPSYYFEKYQDKDLLLNLTYLMLLRQRNRGQDAAGIATLFIPYTDRPEQEYLYKDKMISKDAVVDLYEYLIRRDAYEGHRIADARHGSAMLGHVLYCTMLARPDYRYVHPVESPSHWPSKRIVIAMNGNFANNREQREFLKEIGLPATSTSDMETLVECFGHFINQYHQKMLNKGYSEEKIAQTLNLVDIMAKVDKQLRGAYAIAGLTGSGNAFVCRDPFGIRPVYYAQNEEFFVAASEMSAIHSTFRSYGIHSKDILELPPGHIIVIDPHAVVSQTAFTKETASKPCMFESVYFNRANNKHTYNARKQLGHILARKVYKMFYDISDSIVSYVPNTSQSAALGFYHEILELLRKEQEQAILQLQQEGSLNLETLQSVMKIQVSFEQVLTKDLKIRTFITQKRNRNQVVLNAYDPILDVTEVLKSKRIFLIEDSIVKGTTLERNVIRTLIQAGAQDIIIVSSCPQINYPCPYGIEMSSLKEFISFRAAIELARDGLLEEIEVKVRCQQGKIDGDNDFCPDNLLKELYESVGQERISEKVAEMLFPKYMPGWKGKITVIYPTVAELREGLGKGDAVDTACLDGSYPEIGGLRVLNMALLNYFNHSDAKAY